MAVILASLHYAETYPEFPGVFSEWIFFCVEKCGEVLLNGLGMGGNPPGSPISWQTFSGFSFENGKKKTFSTRQPVPEITSRK